MAIIDDLTKDERAAGNASIAAVRSGLQRPFSAADFPQTGGTGAAVQKPVTPAKPAAKPGDLATALGNAARNNINRQSAILEVGANAAAAPARAAGGFARDVVRGFNGTPNPQAGMPMGPTFDLPRLDGAPPAAQTPVAPTRPSPIVIDGGANAPANPYLRSVGTPAIAATPPAAPVSPVAPAPAPATPAAPGTYTTGRGTIAATPAGVTVAQDAQGNNVFSGSAAGASAGVTAANAAAAPTRSFAFAPTAPVVAGTAAPQVDGAGRGRGGGIIRNPDQGSVAERMGRELTSYQYKGHRTLREAMARSMMADQDADNAERASALALGDRADLQASQANATGAENAATRRFEASKVNAANQITSAAQADDTALKSRALDLQAAAPSQIVRSLDGTKAGVLTAGGAVKDLGAWAPINDKANAGVSNDAQYTALSKRLTDLDALPMPTPENVAERARVQSQIDRIPGAVSSQPRPSLQQFLASAKKQNPGKSDADLTAYYNREYGN